MRRTIHKNGITSRNRYNQPDENINSGISNNKISHSHCETKRAARCIYNPILEKKCSPNSRRRGRRSNRRSNRHDSHQVTDRQLIVKIWINLTYDMKVWPKILTQLINMIMLMSSLKIPWLLRFTTRCEATAVQIAAAVPPTTILYLCKNQSESYVTHTERFLIDNNS